MTAADARKWLIYSSLIATGSIFTFFVAAPHFGFPLEVKESIQLLELVLPVFLGYLGSATHFVFGQHPPSKQVRMDKALAALLVKAPIGLFAVMVSVSLASFGYSNSSRVPFGNGMELADLAHLLAAALGLLTLTTNVTVAYLFGKQTTEENPALVSPSRG